MAWSRRIPQPRESDRPLPYVVEGLEELVHFGDGFFVIEAFGFGLIEEAVGLALVEVEVAAGAGLLTWPPAEPPPAAILLGSTPSSAACWRTQRMADLPSLTHSMGEVP